MTNMPEQITPPLADTIQSQFTDALKQKNYGSDIANGLFTKLIETSVTGADQQIHTIDLVSAKGKEFIGGLFQTQADWKARIQKLKEKLTEEGDKQVELNLLSEVTPLVDAAVQGEITARVEAGETEQLVSGLRELVDAHVEVSLSSPQADPAIARESNLLWAYREAQNKVREGLDIKNGSPLLVGVQDNWDNLWRGTDHEIRIQSRIQRTADRVIAARFLQGVTVGIDRKASVDRKENVAILPLSSVNQDVAARYSRGLETLIDGNVQDHPWDQVTYNDEKKKIQNDDPIVDQHEQWNSRLYDGIHHLGAIPSSADLSRVVGTSDIQQQESFARGKALRCLVEGGDAETYLTMMTQLSPTERQRMAEIGRQMWDSLEKTDPLRKQLGVLLLVVHEDQYPKADGVSPRNEMIQAIGGENELVGHREKLSDALIHGVARQTAERMLVRDIQDPDKKKRSDAVERAVEKLTDMTDYKDREMGGNLARQVVYGQMISDIVTQSLVTEMEKYRNEQVSLSQVLQKRQEMMSALDRMSDLHVLGNERSVQLKWDEQIQPPLSKEARAVVFKASFVRELMKSSFSERFDVQRYESVMRQYIDKAKSEDTDIYELLALHNRCNISLDTADAMVTKALPGRNDEHAGIRFSDVMMKVGRSAGVSVLDYKSRARFDTYTDANTSFLQNYQYVYAESPHQTTGDLREKNREQAEKVTAVLQPLLQEASELSAIQIFSEDLSSLQQQEKWYTNVLMDAKRSIDRNKTDTSDPQIKANQEQAKGIVDGITPLRPQFESLKQIDSNVISINMAVIKWETKIREQDAKPLLSKMFGRNEANEVEKEIKKQILDLTGEAVSGKTPLEVRSQLTAAIQKKKTAIATEIATSLRSVTKGVPDVAQRVSVYLSEKTHPPYQSGQSDQVIESVNIPASNERSSSQSIDPRTEDMKWRENGERGRKLEPLLEEFMRREISLNSPIRQALTQLVAGVVEIPDVLKTAIDDIRKRVGEEDPPTAVVLAGELRTLFLGAMASQQKVFLGQASKIEDIRSHAGDIIADAFSPQSQRIRSLLVR